MAVETKTWRCKYCSHKHYSKEEAYNCERQGNPTFNFKVGDMFEFDDRGKLITLTITERNILHKYRGKEKGTGHMHTARYTLERSNDPHPSYKQRLSDRQILEGIKSEKLKKLN